MQLFIIVLLVLNIIGVLFWIVRSYDQPQNDSREERSQKILENQRQLHREMMEIQAKMERYYTPIQGELEKMRRERQTFEASANPETKPIKEQSLFLNDRYREIFDLKEQGLSAEEIAKKLDKGLGEVSLILELAAQEQS